jgi:hypothetical protein
MRDSGWDQLPPDVRFAGKPAEMRAPPWITACPHQLLTEIPSCEAGYRSARPTFSKSSFSACNARPVHTHGSFSTDRQCLRDVRLSPNSGRTIATQRTAASGQKRPVHRSKQRRYSITSAARARQGAGQTGRGPDRRSLIQKDRLAAFSPKSDQVL